MKERWVPAVNIICILRWYSAWQFYFLNDPHASIINNIIYNFLIYTVEKCLLLIVFMFIMSSMNIAWTNVWFVDSCFLLAVTITSRWHVWLYIEYLFLYFLCALLYWWERKKENHKNMPGSLYRVFIFISCNNVYVLDLIAMHYVNMFGWRRNYNVATYAWYLCIMWTDIAY